MQSMDAGDRVLSLDGGGIRGLIIIEILDAIEKEAGQSIKELFDWVGGTSTGGIIALAIASGKSVADIRDLYFRLKDEVFKGPKPYESEPFETLLKQQFGDTRVMTDIEHPKVVVTSVLADHSPWKLHLFRSYQKLNESPDDNGKYMPVKPPKAQLIWESARSTSAAPTYFRPYNQYFDGGLMSNNPTLDLLTEIHEYNTAQNTMNKENPIRPLRLVVSLGCGHQEFKRNETIPDIHWPTISDILDVNTLAKDTMQFADDLLKQVFIAHGQPINRARAWCEMKDAPFYRFSPLLSEEVPLDCVDEETIDKMLEATKLHINDNIDSIKKVAQMLKRSSTDGGKGQHWTSRWWPRWLRMWPFSKSHSD